MKRSAPLAVIVLGSALGGACAFIDQFPDVALDPPPSSSATGRGGGASMSSASGVSSSSAMSTGGSDGGGGCTPFASVTCYEGPVGTLAKGNCKAGTKTCPKDGLAWGPCMGQVLPTFQPCKSMLDTNCDGLLCDGAYAGGEGFGKGPDQQGTSVAANSSGAVITGHGTGSFDFGINPTSNLGNPGIPDTFLAGFDPTLGPLFSLRFSDSKGRGVALSPSGEIVLVGSALGDVDFGGGNLPSGDPTKQDVFAARFNAAGKHVSSARFGDAVADQVALAVAVAADGTAVLTGALSGGLDCKIGMPLISKGGADVLLAQLGSDSKMLWCASFGDGAEQQGTSVAIAPSGKIIVVGWFSGAFSFGMGAPMLTAVGATDIFVAAFDLSGTHLWSKALPSGNAMSFAKATGVAVDGGGNVYITGFFKNLLNVSNQIKLKTPTPIDENIFVVKLDAGGMPLWGNPIGDSAAQEAFGIAVDVEGNAVVTGRFAGMIDFGTPDKPGTAGGFDVFAAKLDLGGNGIWTRSFGDMVDQAGNAVAIDNLGAAWLTGQFAGSIDFGGGPIQSGGASAVFLAKLTP